MVLEPLSHSVRKTITVDLAGVMVRRECKHIQYICASDGHAVTLVWHGLRLVEVVSMKSALFVVYQFAPCYCRKLFELPTT